MLATVGRNRRYLFLSVFRCDGGCRNVLPCRIVHSFSPLRALAPLAVDRAARTTPAPASFTCALPGSETIARLPSSLLYDICDEEDLSCGSSYESGDEVTVRAGSLFVNEAPASRPPSAPREILLDGAWEWLK